MFSSRFTLKANFFSQQMLKQQKSGISVRSAYHLLRNGLCFQKVQKTRTTHHDKTQKVFFLNFRDYLWRRAKCYQRSKFPLFALWLITLNTYREFESFLCAKLQTWNSRIAHSSILSVTWPFNAARIRGILQIYTFIRRRNKGSNREQADIERWASSWYLDN